MKPDADAIRHALSVAREKGFRKVELSVDGGSFRATLGESYVEDYDDEEEEAGEAVAENGGPRQEIVRAPVVGYLRLLEDGPQAGDSVEQGQLIAEVTALNLANDVNVPISGKLVSFEVVSGEPVEYGQAIAVIEVGS